MKNPEKKQFQQVILFLIFASVSFYGLTTFAEGEVCCEVSESLSSKIETQIVVPIKEMIKSLDLEVTKKNSEECESESNKKIAMDQFSEFIKASTGKGEKIILSRSNYDKRSSNSVTYNFNNKVLQPGESIYLHVPSDLQNRGVLFAILGHRQNPSTDKGKTPGEKMDAIPGLTSVQIYDKNRSEKDQWRYWNGQASGEKGAKFAEVNYNMEMENLYEWTKLGHRSAVTGEVAHDELRGSVVRLKSVGEDPVEIGELTLKTNFSESTSSVTEIFTKETIFGDQKNGQGYELGGGQNNMGIFPDAIALGGYGSNNRKLPDGWKLVGSDLIIPVPKGKILAGVEIAGGDSRPDKVTNDDGGHGSKGHSRLSVGLKKNGQITDSMMRNENVPPEGFLNAAPTTCNRVIQEGEDLVIRADSDTTYIAGIRISFKDP